MMCVRMPGRWLSSERMRTTGIMTTTILPFRAPAVPLIAHDPYFSIWSMGDELTSSHTKHWTGRNHPLAGLVRIDGACHRFAGPDPARVPPLTQHACIISPTATTYVFSGGGIRLRVRFLSPLLANELEVLARPVSYVTVTAWSDDGREHEVEVHLDVSAEIAVDSCDQLVTWSRYRLDGVDAVAVGSAEQRVLARQGDDLRIDWGQLFLAAADGQQAHTAIGDHRTLRARFIAGEPSPADDMRMPRRVNDCWPALAVRATFGLVGSAEVERTVMIAYDDQFSIEYLRRRLRPYWRASGRTEIDGLLVAAAREREAITERCQAFDREFSHDCVKAGGNAFADVAALSYRQSIAAHKLVMDVDGTPMFFSKENFSNGCIATVDVTFPSAPLYLLLNPSLLRAMLEPVMRYAATSAWKFPFAPHDLGTYPLANGQVYGGGELTDDDQMPVEECGNILILAQALAVADGDPGFARAHWPVLRTWACYLRDEGFDPADQLCTDDFSGHLAHNVNLSVKAILGLGSFAELCRALGHDDDARAFRALAKSMVARWMPLADDGDHYRLAFDQPGTWSQKYNLIWDGLLGLDLFPATVARREVAFYMTKLERFGLPLDNRKTYTTLDHAIWSASLAERREDRQAMLDACCAYVSSTPNRVPLSDWYDTVSGRQQGFQARSVVGGNVMPLLQDATVWAKWRSRVALPALPGQAASALARAHAP